MPFPFDAIAKVIGAVLCFFFIEAKNFKQDVGWERADCRCLSVTVPWSVPHKVSVPSRYIMGLSQEPTLTTYILLFLVTSLGGLPDMRGSPSDRGWITR